MNLYCLSDNGWYKTIRAESEAEARSLLPRADFYSSSDMWILDKVLDGPVTVKAVSVLGEVRFVAADKYYGTGHYDCPFCARATVGPCDNPYCRANPNYPINTAQADIERNEARIKEEEERKQNHKWAMERIEQDNKRRQDAYHTAVTKAKEEGYCINCLGDSYRGFKFIRHRKECPKRR